eukprot:COSAG02_NODE_782_length_17259_cov_36.492599_2_plen_1418_part_00
MVSMGGEAGLAMCQHNAQSTYSPFSYYLPPHLPPPRCPRTPRCARRAPLASRSLWLTFFAARRVQKEQARQAYSAVYKKWFLMQKNGHTTFYQNTVEKAGKPDWGQIQQTFEKQAPSVSTAWSEELVKAKKLLETCWPTTADRKSQKCRIVSEITRDERATPPSTSSDEETGPDADSAAAAGSPAAAAAAAAPPTVILPDKRTVGEPKIFLNHCDQLFYKENKEKRLEDFRALVEDDRDLFGTPKDKLTIRGPTPEIICAIKYVRKPGQIFTNYYQWRERLATSDARDYHLSVIEALTPSEDPVKEQERLAVLEKVHGSEAKLHDLCNILHQPGQWKAYAAKAICDRLKPTTVCDSSGGWGERLTGFLAAQSVEKITVIEPRKAACEAFEKQKEDTGSEKDLTVLHGPAEKKMAEVSKNIDLFLTSPPYYPSECYPGHDGGQVHQTAKTKEEYINNFLLPVLRAQAERLSDTGVIALNIADVQKKEVCQPMLTAMEKCADLIFAGTMLLQLSTKGPYEPMYIWCRPGRRDVVRDLLNVSADVEGACAGEPQQIAQSVPQAHGPDASGISHRETGQSPAKAAAASQKQAPEIIEEIPHYETMQIKVADNVWVTIRLNCTGDVKGLKETFPEAFNHYFEEIKKGSPAVSDLRKATRNLSNYQRVSYGRGRRKTVKFPFTVCEPDHFLDVGGNIGLTTVHAMIHGAGHVTIVEPIPSNLELLKENLKQFGSRVTIVEKCVVAQGDDRVKDGMILMKGSKIDTVIGDTEVPVIHLQDLLKEYQPSMCKIDIEGAEIDVLQQDIEWGYCTKLAFQHTLKSEQAAQIQSVLQAAGWDTASWTDQSIDSVLCCTRAPYANEQAAEYLEVLTALRRLNIGIDTDRTKKYKKGDKNFKRNLYGQTLGLKVYGGMAISALTEKNPETVKLITKLARDQLPEDYKFSCVFVTKDSQYPVHIDSGNHGPSYVMTLGFHENGGLWVAECGIDGEKQDRGVLNPHYKFQEFNGNVVHATEEFVGERYSLIYYCREAAYYHEGKQNVSKKIRDELNDLGFRMPDEKEVAPEIVYDPADKEEREQDGMEQYQKYYLEEQESDDGNDVTEPDNGESDTSDMEVESDEDSEEAKPTDESSGSDEDCNSSEPSVKKTIKKKAKKPRHRTRKLTEKELEAELDRLANTKNPLYYERKDGTRRKLTGDVYRRLRTNDLGRNLKSNMKTALRRKNFAQKVNQKVRSGYIDVPGVEKVCGSLRSCMQDTALTGAARIGVTVDKKTLYAECPPRKTKDTSRGEIESAPCLSNIDFEWLNLNHSAGGPTAALLQKTDEGVFFVMSSVEGIEVTSHAFVYDSGYTDPKYPHAKGAIIDNRKNAPVRLLEPSDRVSAKATRKAIDTFFGGAATFVTQVMRMKPKDSKKRGLDVVDCDVSKRARN